MRKTFELCGILLIISAIIVLLAFTSYFNLLIGILSTAITIILGMAFLTIVNLMNRVEFLERHLNVSYIGKNSSSKDLPQKICPICKCEHDFDYHTCPNCNYKYTDKNN